MIYIKPVSHDACYFEILACYLCQLHILWCQNWWSPFWSLSSSRVDFGSCMACMKVLKFSIFKYIYSQTTFLGYLCTLIMLANSICLIFIGWCVFCVFTCLVIGHWSDLWRDQATLLVLLIFMIKWKPRSWNNLNCLLQKCTYCCLWSFFNEDEIYVGVSLKTCANPSQWMGQIYITRWSSQN